MLPNINSLIDRFASAFRITTEIEEKENTVFLHTKSFLGTRLLYEHTLDLSPIINIAVIRAADAAASASKSSDSSQESQ